MLLNNYIATTEECDIYDDGRFKLETSVGAAVASRQHFLLCSLIVMLLFYYGCLFTRTHLHMLARNGDPIFIRTVVKYMWFGGIVF